MKKNNYYDINKLNDEINIMFVGDDGQLWYSDIYMNYQLKEKNKEIKALNLELDKYRPFGKVDNIIKENKELKEEIERLNNNWNELEQWIKSSDEHYPEAIPFRETLRKMKEIKGEYKE